MIDLMKYENEFYQKGFKYIAGVDEVGRGPLAGPVVACAVILKPDAVLKYVNDSKKLTEKRRYLALEEIKNNALAIKVEFVDVADIDQLNIYNATKLAMTKAIEGLAITPDIALIDAMPLDIKIQTKSIIKGDQLSISIASASIVAKIARDEYMNKMDQIYPEYQFKSHKGYPTKKHFEALSKFGITPIHRKSFKPVKLIVSENNTLFNYELNNKNME